MGLLLLLLIYTFIILLEVPPLISSRSWRELLAFIFFSLLALSLGIPWSLGHKFYFPTQTILDFFEPIAQLILGPPV
ncbi:MAG: hypothetical protein GX039_04075 [Clostridia bacterium]|nr:hypothetical protein [Clostridia bacterium]